MCTIQKQRPETGRRITKFAEAGMMIHRRKAAAPPPESESGSGSLSCSPPGVIDHRQPADLQISEPDRASVAPLQLGKHCLIKCSPDARGNPGPRTNSPPALYLRTRRLPPYNRSIWPAARIKKNNGNGFRPFGLDLSFMSSALTQIKLKYVNAIQCVFGEVCEG